MYKKMYCQFDHVRRLEHHFIGHLAPTLVG